MKHAEDLGYSAIVAKFPVHKESIEVMHQAHTMKKGVGVGSASEVLIDDHIQSDDNFIAHRVAFTDTLMGIALFYQVKVLFLLSRDPALTILQLEDIQKANNLNSHQIFHHKVLLIPRPDANIVRPEKQPKELTEEQLKARRERQISLFQHQAGVTEEEAKYYMEV